MTWDIKEIKNIVKEHQCKEINGFLIDVQTANLISTVYDKINDANKERCQELDIQAFTEFCWKQVE